MRTCRRVALTFLLTAVALLRADPPDPTVTQAEKLLQEHRLGTDGPALLAFFKARTLTEEKRNRIVALVRELGDDDFETREKAAADLIAFGRHALPALRAASDDPDLERARRAKQCAASIDSGLDAALTAAAARLLVERRPDGAVPALLAYVPFNDDEYSETAVLEALAALAVRDGRADPALLAALDDKEPARRAAAAFAVGKAGPEERAKLKRLLADADAKVRLRAATALLHGRDRAAVPALIDLLADGPLVLAWQAQELLCRVAGEQAPPVSLPDDAAGRQKARDAWRGWWKTSGDKVDLAKVDFGGALLGVNLISQAENGDAVARIFECRADGKALWEMPNLRAPSDARPLPGGRLLIAEFRGNQVTERDRTGKVLWTHKVANYPTTCQRLPNGNTFIATYGEIMEVTPGGEVVKNIKSPGGNIYRAQRLPNGHVLFLASGAHVFELDGEGKEVRRVPVPNEGTYGGVELLPNGRYLVAMYQLGKVIEVDAAGKIHWEVAVRTASSATRLPNGNTLVSSMDAKEVLEIDRAGKVVLRIACDSRPFAVLRY
jgi:hypothetical protein